MLGTRYAQYMLRDVDWLNKRKAGPWRRQSLYCTVSVWFYRDHLFASIQIPTEISDYVMPRYGWVVVLVLALQYSVTLLLNALHTLTGLGSEEESKLRVKPTKSRDVKWLTYEYLGFNNKSCCILQNTEPSIKKKVHLCNFSVLFWSLSAKKKKKGNNLNSLAWTCDKKFYTKSHRRPHEQPL